MVHDVFISHASSDKAIADAVCVALENSAIRCWIAPRDVQAGRSFAGEITRAIQQSKVMVLIFSAHSNDSEQVLREVQLAVNSHLHIIQFRIKDVHLNDDLEYFLSTPHWLDALTPPLEKHLERLQNAIRSLLGAPPKSLETKTLASHSSSERADDLPDATLFSATIQLSGKPGSKLEFFEKLRPVVANFVSDKVDDVIASLEEREVIMSTGGGFGLACPHAYRPYVKRHFVGVIFIPSGCDWQAADDKPVYVVLLYIGTGGARSIQALSVMGAAHKLAVGILSKAEPNPPDSAIYSEIIKAVKGVLVKAGLSVGVVSFS
jgi:mannitol/fructose-specific phosphotransferase system IIA component (Ntr-type)